MKKVSSIRHASQAGLVTLEQTDRRILHELQLNGRLTNVELAQRVNLSPSACWKRTHQLFEAGVIRGIRAIVEPAVVQQGTIVLVGVVLDRSTKKSFAAFEHAIRDLPQVLECFLVAGEVDYFLKIRIEDLPAFNRFHGNRIIALPGVRQVRTFFVLSEIKTDGLLSI